MKLIHGGAGSEESTVTLAPAVSWLVRHVRATLQAELPNPALPDLPPGGTDYDITFTVPWDPEDGGTGDALLDRFLIKQLGKAHDPATALVDITVGSATCVILDRNQAGLFDAVDARNGELTFLYETLFVDDDLDPKLEDEVANGGASFVVLIDSLEIASPWDQTLLTAAALGVALKELRRGCVLAAIRIDEDEPETVAALEFLGFDVYAGGVHILDLATTAMDSALAKL